MSTVADDERHSGTSTRLWLTRSLAIVAVVVVVGLLAMLVQKLIKGADGPKRQTTKIAILPDTPPPPPPPPKEEPKKEPPKEQSTRPVPQDQPKPAPAAPVTRDVRADEAAGTGNSPFSSGTVTNDGQGGPAGGASSPGGPAPLADRTRDRFYANNARQSLREEIERQLKPEAGELSASLLMWVEPDGRIRRLELAPSGTAGREAELQAALDGTARDLRFEPPPAGMPQPLRFRLTVRSQS